MKMAVYIFIAIFVLITSFCYSHGRDKYLAADMKLLCFLFLFIPAAIRLNIGSDYKSYVRIFYHLKNGIAWDTEIGWNILNKCVAGANLHHQWIFVLASLITYTCILATKKKDAWIAVVIYVFYLYTTSYNAVRNGISIALFWYSYTCICKQKKLQGFLVVLLATFFHSSAYLYIPVYLAMCFVKLHKKTTLVLGVIIYILFMYLRFAQIVLNSPLLGMTRYQKYMVSMVYNATTQRNSGLGVMLRHFYLFFLYWLCDEKQCVNREFSAMSILFLMLLGTDVLATQMFAFYRLRDCFVIGYMAMFIVVFRNKSRNAISLLGKCFVFFYAGVLLFCWGLLKNVNEVVPYTSILGGGL